MKKIFIKIKVSLLIVLSIVLFNTATAQTKQVLEAEAATLSGTAQIAACNNASGGQMVKGLDGGVSNSVLFEKINVDSAGEYFITISYYSVNNRNFSYKLNNGEVQTGSVETSGAWCYQGGIPADFIFKETFAQGDNSLLFYDSPIIDKITISSDTTSRKASALYFSSTAGDDTNDGLTPETAFQTIDKANALKLLPGDSLLFKSGDTFVGRFAVITESGLPDNPILISSYDTGEKPVFDGDGYLSSIHVVNSSHIHFLNIEIKNDGGPSKPGNSEDLRYGMYIENTFTDGTTFEHYRLDNITFKNIYPTTEITDNDQTGVNAHAIFTSGSWGDEINPLRFNDMRIENCLFTLTGRHAAVFKAIDSLVIRNNLFEHVGGAGMVIGSACKNILVEHNVCNYTGSSIDSRMAGRGSGIWCFRSTNLTVQHNKFMHAKGIKDSYGMHIDIGNRNVVYQYNYSEDNEGGFVEILGENVNVGYRYNLSVGDGWRTRGGQKGNIFWLAGWSGDPQNPVGSDSVFVYNNSVYVRDSIAPGILIEAVTENARIYNNIINVPNEFGSVRIENNASYNDFDYNIWYGNIPDVDEDGESYRGPNALSSNPMFTDDIVTDSDGFILLDGSPAIGSGKLIFNSGVNTDFDGYDNHGGQDYFGNLVSDSQTPNRGADNGDEITDIKVVQFNDEAIKVYPNPIKNGGRLKVALNSLTTSGNYTCEIVDLSGKTRMLSNELTDRNIEIDTGELRAGVYILKVTSHNELVVKQFVVY